MMFKAIRNYIDITKKRRETGLKKRYYILFIVVMILFMAYNIFISTELFVPQQQEIVNSKGLFKEMLTEIVKFDTKSDTIVFVYADAFCGCGNNFTKPKSAYENKINKINYNKKNPYFIDIQKSFEERYKIQNKKIVVLRMCSDHRYFEKLNSTRKDFTINAEELENKFNIYREKYKIINKNKVEIIVSLNNSKEVLKLIYIQKNNKWKTI